MAGTCCLGVDKSVSRMEPARTRSSIVGAPGRPPPARSSIPPPQLGVQCPRAGHPMLWSRPTVRRTDQRHRQSGPSRSACRRPCPLLLQVEESMGIALRAPLTVSPIYTPPRPLVTALQIGEWYE